MKAGFELFWDSWWRAFTAGIFFPSLGTLSPSAMKMR